MNNKIKFKETWLIPIMLMSTNICCLLRAKFVFIRQHRSSQRLHNLQRGIFHVAPPQPKFCDLSPQTQSRLLRRPVCKVFHITARKCHARSRKTWGIIGQGQGAKELLKTQFRMWQKTQFLPYLAWATSVLLRMQSWRLDHSFLQSALPHQPWSGQEGRQSLSCCRWEAQLFSHRLSWQQSPFKKANES